LTKLVEKNLARGKILCCGTKRKRNDIQGVQWNPMREV